MERFIIMKKYFYLTVLLTFSLLLVSCGSRKQEETEQITVSGPVISGAEEEPSEDNGIVLDEIEVAPDDDGDTSDDNTNSPDESSTVPMVKSGNSKPTGIRDFEVESGVGSRSAAEIAKVLRQRSLGLRSIYIRWLEKIPGVEGTVTLKFTIIPDGEIGSISVVSSTTGNAMFDTEIKNEVSRWSFSKVKSGITTVTVPLTFSAQEK